MMLALVADLHANQEAVEAVLADARERGAGRYVFLGDLVGYGADPGWVVDTVRRYVAQGAVAVLGNHDQAVVRGVAPSMNPAARTVVGWTHSQLDQGQLAFLESLPMQVEEGDRLYVHANAYAPGAWDYVLSRVDATRSMQATRARYTFCGHVHEPVLFYLSGTGKAGDFRPMPGVDIPVPAHRQWLAIPGSAGQPRDGNPAACYALFDIERQTLTYQRVPYDHMSAASKVRALGLPQSLAERLHDGD